MIKVERREFKKKKKMARTIGLLYMFQKSKKWSDVKKFG